MIAPTVGRVVLLRLRGSDPESPPLAAQIAAVNDDGTLNIGYLDTSGASRNATNVRLVQEEDDRPVADGARESCCNPDCKLPATQRIGNRGDLYPATFACDEHVPKTFEEGEEPTKLDLEPGRVTESFCEWMPYQVGQAKKNGEFVAPPKKAPDVEAQAARIYNGWRDENPGEWKPWVTGGNSDKQEEARDQARKEFERDRASDANREAKKDAGRDLNDDGDLPDTDLVPTEENTRPKPDSFSGEPRVHEVSQK